MKFSVCIPNFNYARYLAQTIQSVLDQTYQDFEILISDNASTDDSLSVIHGFVDPRIRVHANACNVGFAGNLDRVARMATGDTLIMLSSDDRMHPDALSTYATLLARMDEPEQVVLCSAVQLIDAQSRPGDVLGLDREVWSSATSDCPDDAAASAPVLAMDGAMLLRRCLQTMRNPFHFVSTAYSRALYHRVEGYGGGRLYSPDKWFHWRLLAAGARPRYVDAPLFDYRWHGANQAAAQLATSTLRLPVDDYVSSFEVPDEWLRRLSLNRDEVQRAFVRHTIARHGLALVARGNRTLARRMLRFGQACYPQTVRTTMDAWALNVLLWLGPLATPVARQLYRRFSPRAHSPLSPLRSVPDRTDTLASTPSG